jgi:hypothetical protein
MSLPLDAFDSHVVPAFWLLCVTHFKRISYRLGISLLVIGDRTEVHHVQKAAANILNKQLCKPSERGPSCWGFDDVDNILFLKEKTLMYYRTLCNVLKLYGRWSGMSCTVGNNNETYGSIEATEILDQNFVSIVLKKDAAPWSKSEDIPVYATKACGEAEEYRHSSLTSARSGASGRSVIRPGRRSPNEEAPAYPLDRKLRRLQPLPWRFVRITNRHTSRK